MVVFVVVVVVLVYSIVLNICVGLDGVDYCWDLLIPKYDEASVRQLQGYN